MHLISPIHILKPWYSDSVSRAPRYNCVLSSIRRQKRVVRAPSQTGCFCCISRTVLYLSVNVQRRYTRSSREGGTLLSPGASRAQGLRETGHPDGCIAGLTAQQAQARWAGLQWDNLRPAPVWAPFYSPVSGYRELVPLSPLATWGRPMPRFLWGFTQRQPCVQGPWPMLVDAEPHCGRRINASGEPCFHHDFFCVLFLRQGLTM